MTDTKKRNGVEPPRPWWYNLVATSLSSPVLDNRHSVFTNRSLRFDKIRAVGFDFDHTLALYKCAALDGLAMKLVIERLVKEEGFSPEIESNLPDPHFACKGLVVDTKLGNVLKIDRHGHVVRGYHGTKQLSSSVRRKQYGETASIPHVTDGKRFVQVDSAFAKPEVLIFSSLAPDWEGDNRRELWDKIRFHTDMIHRDGSLKKFLMANPEDYLEADLDIVPMLQRLRDSGVKTFLLTNSEWEYTRAMANTAFGYDSGPENLDWIELFDVVVAEARKPAYFQRKSKSGSCGIGEHPKVSCGGNIDELEELLGCGGPEILYVGDHIYADLITSKRKNHWRTMLVIQELHDELDARHGLPGVAMQIKQADERRLVSEHEVHHFGALEDALAHYEDEDHTGLIQKLQAECNRQRERSTKALREFISQREKLRRQMSEAINPYWGSLFRAGPELTHYGRQLEDFACTYTSHASNLALYPSNYYFRSTMDFLPHELQSM